MKPVRGRVAVVLMVLATLLGVASTAPGAAGATTSRLPVITSLSSHSGPTTGGSLVTVHGRQIGPHLLVSFLGRSIGYHRVSASEIVVRVPARSIPGSGWLRVHTTVGGTSAHSSASAYAYRWPSPQITSLSSHLGSTYGGNIVLHGRYLWDVRSVTFGGVRSPQFGGQDTTLYVQVPFHSAATTTVTVTTATGSSRAAGATTSYEFFPPPSITSITPAAGPSTGGQTVRVHGTGMRAPLTATVGANVATNVQVVDPSTMTMTLPPHVAGEVPVVVTTPIGTSGATLFGGTYRYGDSVPARWSDPLTIDQTNPIYRLACVGSDYCMAVDGRGRYLTRGPAGWTPLSDGSAGVVGNRTLSCPTATFCMAVLQTLVWTWNGTSWSPGPPAPFAADDVECVSPTFCEALGGQFKAASWDGAGWSAVQTPSRFTGLNDLSCWAAGSCAAIDSFSDLFLLQDGAWTEKGRLYGGDEYSAVALDCRSATACRAGTAGGSVVSSGGSHITHVVLDDLADLVCTSDTSCVAVGDQSVTMWDGTSWSAPVTAPAEITAVSCPADHSCVVASDHDVRTLSW